MTFWNSSKFFFTTARHALGDPVITAVDAYYTWEDNLPAGYSYNPSTDAVEDKNGNVLDDLRPYWSVQSVDILPNPQSANALPVLAAGIEDVATESFFVFGHESIALMRRAFRVLLPTGEYVVSLVSTMPGILDQYAEVFIKRSRATPSNLPAPVHHAQTR